jgi:UPF0716 protein FxsA
MRFWVLVFFVTPIVEMYLLIRVGGYIGAWPTIGLVALTAVVGAGLLRVQGLATLTRGRIRLEAGQVPAREMAEGLLLAVAGVLLITPGFVTDVLGLLLMVTPARAAVAQRMLDRVVVVGAPRSPGWGGRSPDRPDVIEGEFESRTEPGDDRKPRHRDDPRRLP